MRETWVQSLGWEDPLEKEKATHSSTWPGEFQGWYNQSMGLQRVRWKMNKPSQFQNNCPTNIETPKK